MSRKCHRIYLIISEYVYKYLISEKIRLDISSESSADDSLEMSSLIFYINLSCKNVLHLTSGTFLSFSIFIEITVPPISFQPNDDKKSKILDLKIVMHQVRYLG